MIVLLKHISISILCYCNNIIAVLDKISQPIMAGCTFYLLYNWKNQKNKEAEREYFLRIRINTINIIELFEKLRINHDEKGEINCKEMGIPGEKLLIKDYIRHDKKFLLEDFNKEIKRLNNHLQKIIDTTKSYRCLFDKQDFLNKEIAELEIFQEEIVRSVYEIINDIGENSNNYILRDLSKNSEDKFKKYLNNLKEKIFEKCKM